MDWTEESIARLRSLWDEGLSTAEIGRRLQITKNAVVGKAHRLTLSPRPSPIRKSPDRPVPATPAPLGLAPVDPIPATPASREPDAQHPFPTPPPAVESPPRRPLTVVAATPPPDHDEPASRPAASDAAPPTLRPVPSAPRRPGLTCCWPLGDPGTRDFHFCGGDPIAGKPYCAKHAALAYVRIRDRRDSVA